MRTPEDKAANKWVVTANSWRVELQTTESENGKQVERRLQIAGEDVIQSGTHACGYGCSLPHRPQHRTCQRSPLAPAHPPLSSRGGLGRPRSMSVVSPQHIWFTVCVTSPGWLLLIPPALRSHHLLSVPQMGCASSSRLASACASLSSWKPPAHLSALNPNTTLSEGLHQILLLHPPLFLLPQ